MLYFVPMRGAASSLGGRTCPARSRSSRQPHPPDRADFAGRHKIILHLFPRQLPQILSGVSDSLKEVCASKVGVTAVSFVRLNSQGGFARLLDPTVDLREVNAPLLR